MYDVIIIGGGPAGLTAGIYTSRRGLKTLILTRDIGGQITKTTEIENFPGFENVSGVELAKKFFDQAKKFGAEISFEEAKKVTEEKDIFKVETPAKSYEAKTIILAFGKSPRELGADGEERLKGRGVSYCATCDAPFFRDKTVIVVGGGNSALDAALLSAKFASKVYLVHRGNEFRAEEVLIDQLEREEKIETILNAEIEKINGENKVESASLNNGTEIKADGIIVEVGFIIDRTLIKGLVDLDKNDQVVTDKMQMTSIPGIFAAGDLTETPFKQIIVSCGEGAKAALAAFDYIQKKSGKKGIFADWH